MTTIDEIIEYRKRILEQFDAQGGWAMIEELPAQAVDLLIGIARVESLRVATTPNDEQ